MTSQTDIPTLASLEFIPYLNNEGQLPEQLHGKVGVYAIFDAHKTLQFIGFSRDVFLSLKQHLVRQLDRCYWIKVKTVDRPSRTVLEEIRAAWIGENGSVLGEDALWTQPIQVKALMTPEEKANYANPIHDPLGQAKILKNVARRVEAEILARLKERGVEAEIRFNPKIKEEGLLDLK
ncbi:GIY-YIG nuclease family protein [Myxacorys almedinensis]|uniref:GIY-YIG nuclease family protein n=1 Tax=Myxacorys almedinensis A TaxID=2690445 RepID=A0A8J7Z1L4_9CYAN|nr:GIY-YIG nuclease family protein [Myxacorys almedinensis]NDJ16121.1 GIY-YIG nuclease family protein [Myxacorys almedinensis A]